MAIRFDAAGDYISRTASVPASDPFSVSFWMYITADRNAAGTLFILVNAGGTSFVDVHLKSDGTTLEIGTSYAGNSGGGTSLSTGTWYHIALVRSGASHTLYLNGVSDQTLSNAGTFTTATMGMGSNTVTWLNGRLACIKVWDAALTQSEIQQEMNVIRPVRTNNLNLWTPNFPGATERLADYSGNGRNWTANGTLTDEDPPPVSWGAQTPFGLLVSTATAYSLNLESGSYAISGAAATVTRTRLFNAAAGSYALTGAANSLLAGRALNLGAGSYSVSGAALTLLRTRIFNLAAGSYTLSGVATGLLYGRIMALGSGAYSLTGQAASLLVGRLLNLAAGSYSLTGQAASLLVNRLLTLGPGNYTVTGAAASLLYARIVNLAAGAYTLAGFDATLVVTGAGGYTLILGSGSYSITGQPAALTAARMLNLSAGAYALTGADLVTLYARLMALGSGAYTLSGASLPGGVARLLAANAGAYTVNGNDQTLTATRLLILAAAQYLIAGAAADLASQVNAHDYHIIVASRARACGEAYNQIDANETDRADGQATKRVRPKAVRRVR